LYSQKLTTRVSASGTRKNTRKISPSGIACQYTYMVRKWNEFIAA
jgi:hypothetical protein